MRLQSDFNERAEAILARIEENLATKPEDLGYHVDKAYFLAMHLERYDEALGLLNVLDQTALMADAKRALRVEKLRDRIARAQRYTPILKQPLGAGLPAVSPDPR